MKRWIVTVTIAIGITLVAGAADRGHPVAVRDMGADRAIAGGNVSQVQPVAGDLMAAGGTVDVLAETGGDAMLAGGTLHLDGAVGQSVYAAGGRLTIGAPVQRNVRMAGGTLEIASAARVAGNVSAAGGEIRVLAPIGGYLSAAGGRVLINAPVAGDVDVRAGRIELGPRAAVGGKLRYASRDEIVRDPAARVTGGVERIAWAAAGEPRRFARTAGWVWTAGLVLLAAVLAAVLPTWCERVQRALSIRPGMSAFAGFIALVCLPVLAILLVVTLVGAPLGLLAMLAYPALLLLGYVSVGVALGRIALARWKPELLTARAWQAMTAASCMLLIALAARVPWLGALVVLAATLLGMGSVLLAARSARL